MRKPNSDDDFERGDRKHGRGRKRHERARDESDFWAETQVESYKNPPLQRKIRHDSGAGAAGPEQD